MPEPRWGLASISSGVGAQYRLARSGGDPESCMKTANELRHVSKKILAAYDTQDSHENLPHDYLGGDAGRAFRHGAATAKEGIWTIYNRVILIAEALEDLVDDMDHVDRLLDQARSAGRRADLVEGQYLVEPAGPDFTDFNAAYGHWADADGYWWLAQEAFYETVAGWGVDPGLLPEIPADAHAAVPDGIHLPHGEYAYKDPPRPKNHGFVDPETDPGPHDPTPPVTTPPTGGGGGGGGGGPTGQPGPGGPDGHPHGTPHVPQHHEPELTQKERHQIQQEIKAQHHDVRQLQHRIDQLEQHPPAAGTPAAVTYHAEIRSLQSQIQMHNDQIATLEHTLHPHAGGHDGHPGSHGHRDHLVAGEVHQHLHLQATETPDAQALQPTATDPTDPAEPTEPTEPTGPTDPTDAPSPADPADAPSAADPSGGDDLADGGDPLVHGTHPGQDQPVDAGSSAKDRLAARLEGREVTDATP